MANIDCSGDVHDMHRPRWGSTKAPPHTAKDIAYIWDRRTASAESKRYSGAGVKDVIPMLLEGVEPLEDASVDSLELCLKAQFCAGTSLKSPSCDMLRRVATTSLTDLQRTTRNKHARCRCRAVASPWRLGTPTWPAFAGGRCLAMPDGRSIQEPTASFNISSTCELHSVRARTRLSVKTVQ